MLAAVGMQARARTSETNMNNSKDTFRESRKLRDTVKNRYYHKKNSLKLCKSTPFLDLHCPSVVSPVD